jgi:hypothetical protein
MSVRLTATQEEVKGLPAMPEGLYAVRLDGFKPAWAQKKDSYNLNPILKVTNHADHNDRGVRYSLNTKAKFMWKDFCHCFAVPCPEDASGETEFPGNFGDHPMDKPEQWEYQGPLLGQVGHVYLVQVPATDRNGVVRTDGSMRNDIKYFVCALPGCVERHSDNLIRSK